MRRVIIDTNMLLVPGQHKVDIFTELSRIMEEPYEIIILDKEIEELEKLSKGTGTDAQAARLAKLLVKQKLQHSTETNCKGLKIIHSSTQHVDDAIIAIAEDAFVATNDNELKRRLLERGVRVITLRQQQYLQLSA